MSIIKLPLCSECGVPHVPDEVASRVRSGEDITVEIIPHSNGLVKNVLRWGTGGLNIDATRIGLNGIEHHKTPGSGAIGTQNGIYNSSKEPINRKQIERAEQGLNPRYEPLGRFPSNTLFSHTPLCRQMGVKRVRGNRWGKGNERHGKDGQSIFNMGQHIDTIGYEDKDGMEIVDAWECDPSCPVRILGEQSGVRKSGGGEKHPKQKSTFMASTNYEPYKGTSIGGDTGTAARYFAQFSPSPDELEAPFYYCSKSSKSERNKGCEDLKAQPSQPLFKLRSDLTPEQVAYVEQELAKIGGTI